MRFPSPEVAALLLVLVGPGWGCSDVEIVAECELVDEPVLLVASPTAALRGLAILDDRILVTVVRFARPEEGDRVNVHEARWFDFDGNPVGEPQDLGTLFRHRTRWVRVGDSLMGQVWGDPMARSPDEVSERAWVYRWTLHPERMPDHSLVQLRLAAGGADGLALAGRGLSSGTATLPGASDGSRFVGVFTATPLECGDRVTSFFRLHVFDQTSEVAQALSATEDFCATEQDAGISNPWIYHSPSLDSFVSLFRLGDLHSPVGGRLQYAPLNGESPLDHRAIGGEVETGFANPFQPRAVEHDGTVYFTDLDGRTEVCHRLRTMTPTGGDAGLARWQLPCCGPNDDVMSRAAELAVSDAGPVLVYSQRDGPFELVIQPGDDYEEGIYLTVLTGDDGKRGAELLEITTDASSSFPQPDPPGPAIPGDYLPMVAAQGEDVFVAWEDRRADAPGIYLRRVRCAPL